MNRLSKEISATATLLALSLLLSGCAAAETRPQFSPPENYPSDFADYYTQQVEFVSCGDGLFCSEVSVPVNWNDPESDSIEIAVIYREADRESKGFVFFNPGGPGSSGFDWIADSGDFLGTKTLRDNFNILSFDPRGVGRSSGVKCLSNSEYDEFLYGVSGFELGSADDLAAARYSLREFGESCLENTGEVLGFVDTISAAKDMDVLRAVVGQQKLDYLGYSYGSLLGTTYAALFPERVGRLVLDGAIDPTVPEAEQTRFQIAAFEKALRAFLDSCDEFDDCPFTGPVDSDLERIQEFMFQLERSPLPTESGRELTIWAMVTGLIMPLYSESYWPALSSAFDEAFMGEGTKFLQLADFYNDRDPSGKYSTNLIAANFAISCLDGREPSEMEAMTAENERLLEVAPTLGRYWQFGGLRCEMWPFESIPELPDYSAKGSPTIMVIGTTGDPATPYSQAVSLAKEVLSNGFLVTYNGEGHTIYGQSVSCIDDVVDEFFLSGELPPKDPQC